VTEELEWRLFPVEPLDQPQPNRQRALDPVWDEMGALFGQVASGTNAHRKRNKAVKDMKLLGATPESIRYAHRQYQEHFAGTLCTDTALATHYPLLVAAWERAQATPPCPQCGVGGGMHSTDCVTVTSANRDRIS